MPRSDAPGRTPPVNRLLAALPPREYERLLPHLRLVPLPFRAVLQEANKPIPFVYFPASGVISLLMPPEGKGEGVEVGLVGRKGSWACAVFLGVNSYARRWVVQAPGEAWRMRAADFRATPPVARCSICCCPTPTSCWPKLPSPSLCNALHPVEERLCRWVLMMHTRTESDHFPLTHAFLAAMLGVRRASVTEAVAALPSKEAGP